MLHDLLGVVVELQWEPDDRFENGREEVDEDLRVLAEVGFVLGEEHHRLDGQGGVVVVVVQVEMKELLEWLLEIDDNARLVIQEELENLEEGQPALLFDDSIIGL